MSQPVPEVDHGEAPDSGAPHDRAVEDSEDSRSDADVPGVSAARARLEELDTAPLEEHVGIYEEVHQRLQEGLADLDER